jgi:L,D-transpeptidase catalytic domain
MKNILIFSVILLLLFGNIYFYIKSKEVKKEPFKAMSVNNPTASENLTVSTATNYATPAYDMNVEMRKVKTNEMEVKEFAKKNKCNLDYAFIIDMRIPSHKKRFFVYNLKKDSIINTGFVAHGTGSETFKGALVFSNKPDSRCTSLGKYKIGGSYKGIYGFSYKLHGVDTSNNNAFARAVVLHAHACVPDRETDEFPICFSYGCPMVSLNFLQILKSYISKQGKTPILMSIIY